MTSGWSLSVCLRIRERSVYVSKESDKIYPLLEFQLITLHQYTKTVKSHALSKSAHS